MDDDSLLQDAARQCPLFLLGITPLRCTKEDINAKYNHLMHMLATDGSTQHPQPWTIIYGKACDAALAMAIAPRPSRLISTTADSKREESEAEAKRLAYFKQWARPPPATAAPMAMDPVAKARDENPLKLLGLPNGVATERIIHQYNTLCTNLTYVRTTIAHIQRQIYAEAKDRALARHDSSNPLHYDDAALAKADNERVRREQVWIREYTVDPPTACPFLILGLPDSATALEIRMKADLLIAAVRNDGSDFSYNLKVMYENACDRASGMFNSVKQNEWARLSPSVIQKNLADIRSKHDAFITELRNRPHCLILIPGRADPPIRNFSRPPQSPPDSMYRPGTNLFAHTLQRYDACPLDSALEIVKRIMDHQCPYLVLGLRNPTPMPNVDARVAELTRAAEANTEKPELLIRRTWDRLLATVIATKIHIYRTARDRVWLGRTTAHHYSNIHYGANGKRMENDWVNELISTQVHKDEVRGLVFSFRIIRLTYYPLQADADMQEKQERFIAENKAISDRAAIEDAIQAAKLQKRRQEAVLYKEQLAKDALIAEALKQEEDRRREALKQEEDRKREEADRKRKAIKQDAGRQRIEAHAVAKRAKQEQAIQAAQRVHAARAEAERIHAERVHASRMELAAAADPINHFVLHHVRVALHVRTLTKDFKDYFFTLFPQTNALSDQAFAKHIRTAVAARFPTAAYHNGYYLGLELIHPLRDQWRQDIAAYVPRYLYVNTHATTTTADILAHFVAKFAPILPDNNFLAKTLRSAILAAFADTVQWNRALQGRAETFGGLGIRE